MGRNMSDYEFAEIVAEALGLSDVEYLLLLEGIDTESETEEELLGYDDERGDAWEEEIESEYELDDTWPDDDWLEPYEEWEISPDYGEH